MNIHFYGTKGYVEESSKAHAGHSAFVLEDEGFRLLCDFGENRKGMLAEDPPGRDLRLARAPRPRLGTLGGDRASRSTPRPSTHELLRELPLPTGVTLEPEEPVDIGPFRLTPIPVDPLRPLPVHRRAHRDAAGCTLVYSGDIVAFEDPDAALAGADLYIGDGSTLRGSLVRRHPSGALIGHTTVRAQLGWLARHGVLRAIFSHFGKGPIEMGERGARRRRSRSSRPRSRRAAP